MNYKWDSRFMKLALEVATWSKDPSTQVGSVIANGKKFVSLGFNGPPAKVTDNPHLPRALKYKRTIHAEDNAMIAAQRDLDGHTIYVTHHPCANCAAKIIQHGIARVVCPEPDDDFISRWSEDMNEAQLMFKEAGVKLVFFLEDIYAS